MKRYIKAEWELYKKNKVNIIIGLCGMFIFCLLLLFSGVGTAYYAISTSIVGYVAFLFFLIGMYLSPASHWVNKQKVVIPTEQFVSVHGESKRTYWKIRMVALCVLYFGMVSVIAVMQVPAALIAGERYFLWSFGVEILVLTALIFLGTAVLFLMPSRTYPLAIPTWTGVCGGIAGGILGSSTNKTKEEVFGKFLVVLLVAIPFGVAAIVYRWIKTIKEERGGFRKTKQGNEER